MNNDTRSEKCFYEVSLRKEFQSFLVISRVLLDKGQLRITFMNCICILYDFYYIYLQLFHCLLIINLIDLMNAKGSKRLEVSLCGQVKLDHLEKYVFLYCSFICICCILVQNEFHHGYCHFSLWMLFQLSKLRFLTISLISLQDWR